MRHDRHFAAGAAAAATLVAAVVTSGGTPASAQTPGTQIVDSKGALVGLLNGDGEALRRLPDGQWVAFLVLATGLSNVAKSFRAPPTGWDLLYTSSNCTGTVYLGATALPARGFIVNSRESNGVASDGVLYYAQKPFTSLPILSVWLLDLSGKYTCGQTDGSNGVVGPAKSLRLNFAPPFSIR